jgi:hypothetical protein
MATDSERLDWLQRKNEGWSWKIDTDESGTDIILAVYGYPTLREAIDAAMAAEKDDGDS